MHALATDNEGADVESDSTSAPMYWIWTWSVDSLNGRLTDVNNDERSGGKIKMQLDVEVSPPANAL